MALSAAERKIADDLLAHNLDLFRMNASLRLKAYKTLKSLEAELVNKLSGQGLTDYGKAATDYLLQTSRAIIKDYHEKIAAEVNAALKEVSAMQEEVVRTALADVGYGAAIAPATHFATALSDVMLQGAPSSEWWARQADDVAFKFANAVRLGIVKGETNAKIMKDVKALVDGTQANIAALVQTSVQTVANEARMQTFKQNADIVDGVQQVSTLDSHTTDICMAYSGAEWNLEEDPINDTTLPFNGGPPRHWNCRSVLVPITKTFAELGIDAPEFSKGQRASADGPIDGATSFDSFLERKGKAFQDEALGVGRAQLWRDGKITLSQLLDQRGNPLSLAQLKAKYGK